MPDWARAHGDPLFTGLIRERPEDFIVDELLGFEPSGEGEHDLVRIRKTSANTAWVARRLSSFAGIPAREPKRRDLGHALEHGVDRGPQLPDPLAVDDAHVVDARFPAREQIVLNEILHVSRTKGVEVQDTVDGQLHRLRLEALVGSVGGSVLTVGAGSGCSSVRAASSCC